MCDGIVVDLSVGARHIAARTERGVTLELKDRLQGSASLNIRISLSEPATAAELEEYYELRWRILREPWHQPRGSERDELEDVSRHLMARSDAGKLIGVGRIHWNSDDEAQIRYMATRETHQRTGAGSAILARLEQFARERGTAAIVINAREPAVPFYRKFGYRIIGDSATLFGVIPHKRMHKRL